MATPAKKSKTTITSKKMKSKYDQIRRNMVDTQLSTNAITNDNIVAAFKAVPKEIFVEEEMRSLCYIDRPLRVLETERFMLEPLVLAKMLQEAEVKKTDVVLTIGGATGYSAALLSAFALHVYIMESQMTLVEHGKVALNELEVDNVTYQMGSIEKGLPKLAPFDVILIEGSVAEVPQELMDQLADGGRLFAVVGDQAQGRVMKYKKHGDAVSSACLMEAVTPEISNFAGLRDRFEF